MDSNVWYVLASIVAGFLLQILTAIKGRKKTNVGIVELATIVKSNHEQTWEKLKDQDQILNGVKAELTDNGGGSTKDGIRLIREDLKEVKANVSQLGETLEAKFAIQMNESPEAVFKFNHVGECDFANEKMVELMGLPYARIKARGFLSAIGRDQKERLQFWDDWIDAVEQNIPFESECFIKNQTTGEMKRCQVRTTAFRSGSNPDRVLFYYGKIMVLGPA